MPLFSDGKLAAGLNAAQMPADVTWQADDGAGHDGARSAHQVANTAHVPAAPAKTPPPAALRPRAQPVAAAPEVLRARPAFKVKRQRLPHATAASVATQPQLHAASSIAPRPSASDEDFTCVPSRFAGAASSTTAFFRPRAVIASAADAADAAGAPGRAADVAADDAAATEAAAAAPVDAAAAADTTTDAPVDAVQK